MGGKKGADNSKKAAGQARKADAAAAKTAAEDARNAAAEDDKWAKGAKNNAKKEAEAAKKAEQARKKAENAALVAEDESNTPGRALPKKNKTAQPKPSRSIGSALSQLDLNDNNKLPALSGSGIDNGLAVFDAADSTNIKLDQHPERRRKAAFEAFKARREDELKAEGSKLKFSQRQKLLHEEFLKSPENPFNQAYLSHDATREEREAAVQAERERKENIYAEK